MHHSNKIVTATVWLLTSLAALHLGLLGLGFNIWEQPMIAGNELLHKLVVPLHWAIGLAGLWSLVVYVQWVMGGCDECHCKSKK